MTKPVWRFIDSAPADAATNMAVDEALLASFDPACSVPVFRLYSWNPPAFSLGRFQKASASLDLHRCRESGIDVVRRITAGGIIYHADEITYSIVCAPRHLLPARTVKESFERLCGFLLLAYSRLGLKSSFAIRAEEPGAKLGEKTEICFAGREEYDILVEGRKLGGNAQRRTRDVVFQHGSIPLSNCLKESLPFFYAPARPERPDRLTAALREFDRGRNKAEIRNLLAESFAEHFGVRLQEDALDPSEQENAARLRALKYSSDRWNMEGGR
jgi:lipoate-protein ligase A